MPTMNPYSAVAPQDLRIAPTLITRTLFAIVLVLILCGLASNLLLQAFPDPSGVMATFIRQFELDRERNIPAWFSTLLIFSNAGLLGMLAFSVYSSASRWFFHWAGLALIFLYLSLDEMVSIHEWMGYVVDFAEPGGVFTFSWVIPAGALLVVLAVAYGRFLLALPARTRFLFILAGAVYVLGAVGMEMLSGLRVSMYSKDATYEFMTVIEEGMEMTGQVIFCFALMSHLARSSITLRFAASGSLRHGPAGPEAPE